MKIDPTKDERIRKASEEVSKRLTDEGLLIEAGFAIFAAQCFPPTVGEQQKHDMRVSFFAGAQHLWGSVMSILDPGDEATENDERRMDMINEELGNFAKELKRMMEEGPPK